MLLEGRKEAGSGQAPAPGAAPQGWAPQGLCRPLGFATKSEAASVDISAPGLFPPKMTLLSTTVKPTGIRAPIPSARHQTTSPAKHEKIHIFPVVQNHTECNRLFAPSTSPGAEVGLRTGAEHGAGHKSSLPCTRTPRPTRQRRGAPPGRGGRAGSLCSSVKWSH